MHKHQKILLAQVDKFGSASLLADAINKELDVINSNLPESLKIKPTYQQKIHQWIYRDTGMNPQYVLAASKATGVPCHELRPDIFPVPANECDAQSTQSA